jgi:Recombination endonuclease VII
MQTLTTRTCIRCGEERPDDAFSIRTNGYADNRCIDCKRTYWREKTAAWYHNNTEAWRENQRAHWLMQYGLTPEKYAELLFLQGGVCAICRGVTADSRALHVDHDHSTGTVRGLLCEACNFGLGQFRDNVEFLREAIVYLERSSD